jgi:hypothetical protein
MAVAVARLHAPRAYLVAGASAPEWGTAEGAELFASRVCDVSDLLSDYDHRWKFWRADVKTHPLSLPRQIATRLIESAPMTVDGSAWELRCAEVFASDSEWVVV